jgi:hypothetical protein
MTWAQNVARIGVMRNMYKIFAKNPEGKRSLGRHRRRWEDNIRIDLTEIGWIDVGWIRLDCDRDQWRAVVNT